MTPILTRFVRYLAVWLVLLSGGWLGAAEYRQDAKKGATLVVQANEVIEDDLYLVADNIVVEGTIKGDLIAFGQNITIKGTVEGDLIAAGQCVLVEGTITDDAQLAGEVVKLGKSAQVRDLTAGAHSLECEAGSQIEADLVYGGAQALLAGKIGRDLWGTLGSCQLHGEVGRNVQLVMNDPQPSQPMWHMFVIPPPSIPIPEIAGGLAVAKDAKVAGKLSYTSWKEATVEDPAVVAGGVEHNLPDAARQQQAANAPPPIQKQAENHLKNMAGIGLFGLLAVLILPRWSREMADNLRKRPLASVLSAFLGLFVFAVLLAFVFGATLLGIAIFSKAELELLTISTALAGFFSGLSLTSVFLLVTLFLAPAVACAAIGRLLLRSPSIPTVFPFVLGLIVLLLLSFIPFYAGLSILGLATFLGFGAFCVWLVVGGPPVETAQKQ